MSEIYRSESSHSVYGGTIIDVSEEGIERITKILEGINGGRYQAIGSALARAAASGKTVAKRAVTDEYTLSGGTFLAETKNINHFVKGDEDIVEVVFGFRGYVIPLIKFSTSVDANGQIHTSVKKTNVKKVLDGAFLSQVGHHKGVFERVGADRLPIRELYGPATPQMMYANEAVMDKIEEKIVEVYEDRIEHEIYRILSGYNVKGQKG